MEAIGQYLSRILEDLEYEGSLLSQQLGTWTLPFVLLIAITPAPTCRLSMGWGKVNSQHWLINYLDSKAKCCHLKTIYLYRPSSTRLVCYYSKYRYSLALGQTLPGGKVKSSRFGKWFKASSVPFCISLCKLNGEVDVGVWVPLKVQLTMCTSVSR